MTSGHDENSDRIEAGQWTVGSGGSNRKSKWENGPFGVQGRQAGMSGDKHGRE